MRVGILRCAQTEDYCPGTADFLALQDRQGAFAGVTEEVQLVGFVSCGGCPGKKALLRAREMARRGADTLVLASCICKGTPIGYPCSFASEMLALLRREFGDTVRILDHTH